MDNQKHVVGNCGTCATESLSATQAQQASSATGVGSTSFYQTDPAKDVDGFTFNVVIDLRNRQSTLRCKQQQIQSKLDIISTLLTVFED